MTLGINILEHEPFFSRLFIIDFYKQNSNHMLIEFFFLINPGKSWFSTCSWVTRIGIYSRTFWYWSGKTVCGSVAENARYSLAITIRLPSFRMALRQKGSLFCLVAIKHVRYWNLVLVMIILLLNGLSCQLSSWFGAICLEYKQYRSSLSSLNIFYFSYIYDIQ